MNTLAIALSGMQAAQTQLNVTAQNIANLQTPGYQEERTDFVELSGGGVSTSVERIPTSSSGATGPEGSNVDLAQQMVNLSLARQAFRANAEVARVANSLTGTLLDMFDTDRRN